MEIQSFYFIFTSFRPTFTSFSERHGLSFFIFQRISALILELFGFIFRSFGSTFSSFDFSRYSHFKFHHNLVVFDDFFNEGFFIFGSFGSTSSFIVVWVIIFIWIQLIVWVLIIVLVFHVILVFLKRTFWLIALGILGVVTLVWRVIRVLIVFVAIILSTSWISEFLLHKFIDHRVIVLHGN